MCDENLLMRLEQDGFCSYEEFLEAMTPTRDFIESKLKGYVMKHPELKFIIQPFTDSMTFSVYVYPASYADNPSDEFAAFKEETSKYALMNLRKIVGFLSDNSVGGLLRKTENNPCDVIVEGELY